MSITEVFAGVEQADNEALTTGGRTFRCFAWAAGADAIGPQRVEAKVFVDGEDGQVELVDASIVATAVGELIDCPRVLAIDGVFVVHWIDSEVVDLAVASSALYRSMFDMTDIASGWSTPISEVTHPTNQYDHAVVLGSSPRQFVVSHRTAAGTITTTRYQSPFAWTPTSRAWAQSDAGLTIADSVLAVHADESNDDVVLISYQSTLTLRTIRRSATTGGSQATSETFADLVDGDMHFTAVSHKRIGDDLYLVGCEAAPADEVTAGRVYARLVGFRVIEGTNTAVQYESQWLYGWHLLSRLWTWASGVTGQVEAFALIGWKSIADGQEFDQMIGACVRFDVEALAGANAAGVVRPIPVCALTAGSLDTRPHGSSPSAGAIPSIGTRVNHLSHASGPPQYTLGPDRKTVLVATVRWQRLVRGNQANELQPASAAVGFYRHYHEDEWTVQRDEKEVAQPATPAWRGANSRPMALPVEITTGLVLAGGVTVAYDGQQPVELGFFHAPEISVSVGAGAIGDAATYYWYANYVWTDNRGGIHRGTPSRPVSLALTAIQGGTVTCRSHNLGMKDDVQRYPLAANRPISIEVWRTTAAGGIPETSGPSSAPLYIFRREYGATGTNFELKDTPTSDPDAFTVSIPVGRPNNEVLLNEIAPFQLDLTTLQWTPPPPIPLQPLAVGCVWQNRLFGVDPELGLLRWSEEILPLGASMVWPEFLDTNVFRLDNVDEVLALVPIENDMAVLSRNGVDTLSGDPGAGGSGNTFQLRTIARGLGCIEPRSVCSFTDGFSFQSPKRLHIFTRTSGIEDIGAPIEDFLREAGNVRSAVYLEDRDELRFGFQEEPGTGPLLVRPRLAIFNLRTRFWVLRNIPMVAQSSTASRLNEHQHATAWRGLQGETIHVVLYQGGLHLERPSTSTVFSDEDATSTTTIRLECTTEWIHLGLDDTKRFHEIGIQTERVHAGALTVEAWYDHDGSWDSDTGAAQQTLTIASPAPEFIRFRPTQGKCRGIKLRIFEPTGVAATENVRLVALVLHYSVKKQRQGSRNNAG